MKNKLIKKLSNEFKEIRQTMDDIDYWNSFREINNIKNNKMKIINKEMDKKEELVKDLMLATNKSKSECFKWLNYMNFNVEKALKALESTKDKNKVIEALNNNIGDSKSPTLEIIADKEHNLNDIYKQINIMNLKLDKICDQLGKIIMKF